MKGFAKWRTVTVLHELLILTSKTPENSQITTKARDTKEAGYKNSPPAFARKQKTPNITFYPYHFSSTSHSKLVELPISRISQQIIQHWPIGVPNA